MPKQATSSVSPLAVFPRELVERILLLLDTAESMLRCSLVNKEFNDIIRSSTLLQYSLACKAAGVIDDSRSPLSYAERLEVLENREDAWKKLVPMFEKTIAVKHQPSYVYGLTAGTYFLGDNILRDLHYCHLPSSPQDNPHWMRLPGHGPERNWTGTFVNFAIAFYEHDLIVNAISSKVGNQADMQQYSLDLVLLRFSTGEYHSLACFPKIHVQRSSSTRPLVYTDVVGDNLALVVNSRYSIYPDKLFVFDWKTGHRRLKHEAIENAYSELVFISSELLLVPNFILSHFEVWDISPCHRNPEAPCQVLCLKLPTISPSYSLFTLECHAEPNPFLHSLPYIPPRPFFSSPENSILVTNLRFAGFRRTSYTLIMHRRALLDVIQKWTSPPVLEQQGQLAKWLTNEATVHQISDSDDGFVRIDVQSKLVWTLSHPRSSAGSFTSSSAPQYDTLLVQWADWGPPISRWFQSNETQATWIATSSGQRCAFLTPNPNDRRKSIVSVADFNPYNFRRNAEKNARGRKSNDDNEEGKVKEENAELERFEHRGVFLEEVYMGLKCAVYHASDEYDFDGLLMDEARLLGLKLNDEGKDESITVLYFG